MKKLYTLIGAALFTSSLSYGQVEIREFNGGQPVGNDISGTTVTVNISEDGLVMRSYNILNTSSTQKNYTVMRLRLTEVSGWTDGLCWGPNPDPMFQGQCYGSGQMPTNPWTTPVGITVPSNDDGNIVVDIHTEGGGCGLYRYFIMEGNTKVDSLDVEVCSVASVQENEEVLGMTAYPNPANNVLTVNTTGTDGICDLRITDVLGKVVFQDEVGAIKKLDVSNFRNGVYLVTVMDKGVLIQTRRVVIKH